MIDDSFVLFDVVNRAVVILEVVVVVVVVSGVYFTWSSEQFSSNVFSQQHPS